MNYGGRDLLYVFSSSVSPLEADRAYRKFTVCALLEYSGDFRAAAKALAAQGYGTPYTPPQPSAPPGSDSWEGMTTLPLRPYTGYGGLRYREGAIHG